MPMNVKKTRGPSKDDYGTPRLLASRIVSTFGLNLDVCATYENAVCEKFFGPVSMLDIKARDAQVTMIGTDGLRQHWQGYRCFMNPPYSRGQIDIWMRKAKDEVARGNCTVVALIPASLSERWWWEYVQGHAIIVPIRGRVKFVGAKQGAQFASVLAIYLPKFRCKGGELLEVPDTAGR